MPEKNLLYFKAYVARVLVQAPCRQTKGEAPVGPPPPLKRRAATKGPPEVRFGHGNQCPQLTEAKKANRCHGPWRVHTKDQGYLHAVSCGFVPY